MLFEACLAAQSVQWAVQEGCSVCPVGCAGRVLSLSSGLCREGALSVQWAVQGGWSSQVYILHGDPFPPPSLNPEIQFLPQGFKPEYTRFPQKTISSLIFWTKFSPTLPNNCVSVQI